jgi:hypothetical protein
MNRHFLTISVSSLLIVILISAFGMSLAIGAPHHSGHKTKLPHDFKEFKDKPDSTEDRQGQRYSDCPRDDDC